MCISRAVPLDPGCRGQRAFDRPAACQAISTPLLTQVRARHIMQRNRDAA